jgi:hypothetical protein
VIFRNRRGQVTGHLLPDKVYVQPGLIRHLHTFNSRGELAIDTAHLNTLRELGAGNGARHGKSAQSQYSHAALHPWTVPSRVVARRSTTEVVMLGRASATMRGAVWPHLKCFLPYIEWRKRKNELFRTSQRPVPYIYGTTGRCGIQGGRMKMLGFRIYYDEDSGKLTRVEVGTDFAAETSLFRADVLKGCIEHFIKQYNATITEQHLKETEVLWVPWKWVPTTIDITADSSTGTGPGPKPPGGRP